MNSILRRRRAAMGEEKDTSILWRTENQSVTGGSISTFEALCSTDKTWSCAYDVSLTSVVSSGGGSEFRLIRVVNEAVTNYAMAVYRAAAGGGRNITFCYMSSAEYVLKVSSGDRLRFVFQHEANSGEATYKIRKNNDEPISGTIIKSFIASSKNAVLGQDSGVNQLPICTLNKVVLRNRVLTSDEINDFLGV